MVFGVSVALAACGGSDDDGDAGAGTAGSDGDSGGTSGGEPLACSVAVPRALRSCTQAYGDGIADCYQSGGAACTDGDAALSGALDDAQALIEANCSDGEFLAMEVSAVTGRVRTACASEADSASWRVYGGPQGAVWPGAGEQQPCLSAAHAAATDLIDGSLEAIDTCLADGSCDAAAVDSTRADLASAAQSAIEAACSDLAAVVALDPATYVARVAQQVECLAAVGHPDTGPLDFNCGPGNAEIDVPRGEWTKVLVDDDKWGTLCGDGTGYAFFIRPAPEGQPLDRVLVALEGGGVCLFEDDCSARFDNASTRTLFNAIDDELPERAGVASDDPAESPFANYTKLYLPYCNQDVFAGGGVTEELGAFSLPRYGSVNLRAAMMMVRDYLWRELDAAGGPGFRPDEVVTLFGGFSAGGYGTNYNYHWILDDLQWPRTTAYPDAGLGLDNGSLFGVGSLGFVKIPEWGMLPNLPPYCFDGGCAVGPVIYEAAAPRLKRVPEQQMLILSNQRDTIQQGDAFFMDEPSFVNAMREAACETRDLPGIQWYLTSADDPVHVVSVRTELWEAEVGGETMRDFFVRAVEQPDTLEDRMEEANFVDLVPGVSPFPCTVSP